MKKDPKNTKNITIRTDCSGQGTCTGGTHEVCDAPYYSPLRDYEKKEAGIERMMKSIFGLLTPGEMAEMKARRLEGLRRRKERAITNAQTLMKETGRPVCRRDLLEAMDQAIWDRTSVFDRRSTTLNAAWLLGTVACRNMMLDSLGGDPCPETDPDGGDEE